MLLLFLRARVIASSSVNGIWFVTSTPTRFASGKGRDGASKFGATGGGSLGRTAGATPVVPTFCVDVGGRTAFGFAICPLGVVPVGVCGCPVVVLGFVVVAGGCCVTVGFAVGCTGCCVGGGV